MARRAQVIPKKYAGKWIAWDHGNKKIVASGKTFKDAHAAALKAGEEKPWLDKVPQPDIKFAGGVRP
mgnify:CR=1 FL=1